MASRQCAYYLEGVGVGVLCRPLLDACCVGGAICVYCGAVLPLEKGCEPVLQKLSQLARFGLTGEARPLLEHSEDG